MFLDHLHVTDKVHILPSQVGQSKTPIKSQGDGDKEPGDEERGGPPQVVVVSISKNENLRLIGFAGLRCGARGRGPGQGQHLPRHHHQHICGHRWAHRAVEQRSAVQ